MAICRVYLCTYRRNHLLPRALNSLLKQTFSDWVCELHNDDPQDPFPRQLVEKIADPRISIMDHAQNLGPMGTFNLIFAQKVEEQLISLLEDDNWWQFNFLETMIQVMNQYPNVRVAWSNMQLWREEEDGSWTNTETAIWQRSPSSEPELFHWPNQHQIFGALHSQGAMLIRSERASDHCIPAETTSAACEHVRERTYSYPIVFVPQILANFALTRETSRSKHRKDWAQVQLLLAGSFFKHVLVEEDTLRRIWHEASSKSPRSTGILFFVAMTCVECRKLLKYATLTDWLLFIVSCFKRPLTSFQILNSINANQNLWNFLDRHTALRIREAQEQGFKSI